MARFPHLPMVEDRQGKGLALGMSAEISLKAERVDGWDESFDGVERGAWNGCILGHVPPERERQRSRPQLYTAPKQRVMSLVALLCILAQHQRKT